MHPGLVLCRRAGALCAVSTAETWKGTHLMGGTAPGRQQGRTLLTCRRPLVATLGGPHTWPEQKAGAVLSCPSRAGSPRRVGRAADLERC